MSHGPGETLLTGSAASKVQAAALAAVPGAKVIRVETDSAGAAYEAHLQKSDGSYVTVKLDRSFKVTATQSGFGGGPAR
jgi:glutamate 5-kinase